MGCGASASQVSWIKDDDAGCTRRPVNELLPVMELAKWHRPVGSALSLVRHCRKQVVPQLEENPRQASDDVSDLRQQACDDVRDLRQQASDDASDLRQRASSVLLEAISSGKLKQALKEAKATATDTQAVDDVDDLRKQVSAILMEASSSGKLAQACKHVKTAPTDAQDDSAKAVASKPSSQDLPKGTFRPSVGTWYSPLPRAVKARIAAEAASAEGSNVVMEGSPQDICPVVSATAAKLVVNALIARVVLAESQPAQAAREQRVLQQCPTTVQPPAGPAPSGRRPRGSRKVGNAESYVDSRADKFATDGQASIREARLLQMNAGWRTSCYRYLATKSRELNSLQCGMNMRTAARQIVSAVEARVAKKLADIDARSAENKRSAARRIVTDIELRVLKRREQEQSAAISTATCSYTGEQAELAGMLSAADKTFSDQPFIISMDAKGQGLTLSPAEILKAGGCLNAESVPVPYLSCVGWLQRADCNFEGI